MFHTQTCIHGFSKKKKAMNMAHLAHIFTWEAAVNEAWVAATCSDVLSGSPPHPRPCLLRFFPLPIWAPDGPEFGDPELLTASNHQSYGCKFPFLFPSTSFLYLLAVPTPLISIVPKEQLSFSFLFSFLFSS